MSKKFNLEYLLIGVLFIWASILAFNNPASDLIALTIVFGLMALAKGILEIFLNKKMSPVEGKGSKSISIVGIIDLFIGLFFLLNVTVGADVLPFIFAIWFLCDSIVNLIIGRKIIKNKYFLYLFINILGVIFGVILLVNPIVSAITLAVLVGCYLLVTGISYVVLSF